MKILKLLTVAAILLAGNVFAEPSPSTAPGVGKKALAFTEKSTKGDAIAVPEGFKGKLIMLDFWATWCGPCRAELPNLVKVYEEFHAKGFEIVGVSLDNEKTLPKLAQFTEENHMPWPQIADGQFWKAALAQKYDVHSIPASWLIDGTTGLVVAEKAELRGAALRDTVDRCLKNLGKPPVVVAKSEKAAEPAPVAPPRPADPAIAKAEALAKDGKLTGADDFAAQMQSPKREKIDLAPVSTRPLRGHEIAEHARAAHVRIGWFFRCTRCNNWHLNAAGGYAIAKDTVATAFHVLEQPANMRKGEGYPVVIRGESEVLAVTGVLGADKEMDAAIVRVRANDLTPLALAADPQIGDAAFCFSDPNNTRGYFSNGIINRLYSLNGSAKAEARFQRLHVSTDWAPGSSGSAVLDECGNAIGHVARIQSISKNGQNPPASGGTQPRPAEANPTYMNMHEAIPAKSVLTLIGATAK
jgi:thiol-disulfide isomerase/thioredoxin